jgi:hypothetical protein
MSAPSSDFAQLACEAGGHGGDVLMTFQDHLEKRLGVNDGLSPKLDEFFAEHSANATAFLRAGNSAAADALVPEMKILDHSQEYRLKRTLVRAGRGVCHALEDMQLTSSFALLWVTFLKAVVVEDSVITQKLFQVAFVELAIKVKQSGMEPSVALYSLNKLWTTTEGDFKQEPSWLLSLYPSVVGDLSAESRAAAKKSFPNAVRLLSDRIKERPKAKAKAAIGTDPCFRCGVPGHIGPGCQAPKPHCEKCNQRSHCTEQHDNFQTWLSKKPPKTQA